jgi:hypothetical protein
MVLAQKTSAVVIVTVAKKALDYAAPIEHETAKQ